MRLSKQAETRREIVSSLGDTRTDEANNTGGKLFLKYERFFLTLVIKIAKLILTFRQGGNMIVLYFRGDRKSKIIRFAFKLRRFTKHIRVQFWDGYKTWIRIEGVKPSTH